MRTRRGTNLPRMGDFNQSVILEAVRQSGTGLSRIELVEATGLSAQTITNITRRLLDEGLIREAGRTINGPGKPRVTLRLVAESRFAVGVHLDPSLITLVLLDLAGDVVSRSTMRTSTDDPERTIEATARAVDDLIRDAAIDRGAVAGIGVAAPGPLDPHRNTVIDPPKLPHWHTVPLAAVLAEATGLPVTLEKDTTCAVVGELWRRGGTPDDSFIFLYLGTGVGAGLARGGEVVRGSTRNLGEIGHLIVDAEGPECACGARGCVDVVCTPEAVVARAQRSGVLPQSPVRGGVEQVEASFTELCERAAAGDEAAIDVLRRSAGDFAMLTAVLTNMLDVDRVVFGGPFWSRLSDIYLTEVAEQMQSRSATRAIRAVPVAGSVVGDDVGAVGAGCVVLDAVLSPRTADLLLDQ